MHKHESYDEIDAQKLVPNVELCNKIALLYHSVAQLKDDMCQKRQGEVEWNVEIALSQVGTQVKEKIVQPPTSMPHASSE